MIPGRLLLHPITLAAAAVIIANDAYLKPHHPGWLSGKLSDFALCIFLPIWLFALLEWTDWLHKTIRKKPWTGLPHPKFTAITSCTLAGTYFTALQLSQPAAHFHTWWLNQLIPTTQFVVTPDPSDLIALPFLLLAYHLITTQNYK